MKSILFVDDEPNILEGLRNLLRRHRRKWDMTFAAGGPAALELLKTQSFDVIVSDMRMPEVDGAVLLTHVQNQYPRTVRIVLSGHTELETALQAIPVAHQFLNKPCDAAELENVVERACTLQSLVEDPKIRRVIGGIQQLPALPRVYHRLMQALASECTQADDVAALLQQDMAICAKLLQVVNSAFFRAARRVTSIEEAVRYLGFTMVRNLVLTIEVFQVGQQSAVLSFDALQRHSLRVAGLARELVADPRYADDAFMAGMLHDIGKLVLALQLPDKFQQICEQTRRSQRPLWQMEQESLGVSHAQIGAYLLGLWGLPYPIIEAAAYHHLPHAVPPYQFDVLAAVYVANGLVHETSVANGWPLEPWGTGYLDTLGVLDKLESWRALAKAQVDALTGSDQDD